ncbi:MAG: ROK family protein [Selenomonadaceae bacterium]|nr:ROK family protein [Selenomonadaceae bacterium]
MKITVIDVGGTFIKYACMNESAEIISRGIVETPKSGREEFINRLVEIFESMKDAEGIAISLPGIIDADRGYCVTSGALKFNDNFAIVEALQKKCSVNISIENDARCAAIAEMTLGNLKDVNDGFVMVFGTGIGSAIIKNKKIHRGYHFSAGEISFLITNQDGSIFDEDMFGFKCSTRGLCDMYDEEKFLTRLSDFYGEEDMFPPELVDGRLFFDQVHSGDKFAIECFDRFTRLIAVQIINIQLILDPERIAIGGGISAQKIFIDKINEHLNKIYDKSKYDLPRAEVVACKFLNDANLIGALQNYLEKFS